MKNPHPERIHPFDFKIFHEVPLCFRKFGDVELTLRQIKFILDKAWEISQNSSSQINPNFKSIKFSDALRQAQEIFLENHVLESGFYREIPNALLKFLTTLPSEEIVELELKLEDLMKNEPLIFYRDGITITHHDY